MESIDCIFFDFDGTLADTEKDLAITWKKVIAEQKLFCPEFDSHFRVGPTLAEMADELFPDASAEDKDRAFALYRKIYVEDGYPNTNLYPGVYVWLENLISSGKKIYVATNKYKAPTEALLKKLDVTHFFLEIFAPDSFPGKIMPKHVFLGEAIKKLNLNPEHCIMIGDTVNDLKAGHANNMKTGAVLWGYGNPDLLTAEKPDFRFMQENEKIQRMR